MKQIVSVFLFFISLLSYSQTDCKRLADSLRYVEEVPYIQNCDDPVFWKAVSQGLDIVPYLIDKMTDTKKIDAYVPNFGGKYTVADVAYQVLNEIIGDIPTFKLLGVEFDEKDCGYCSYWFHVRESKKNRKKFQQAVRKWYEKNKAALVWAKSSQSVIGDCFNPITGGHFEVHRKEYCFLFKKSG